MQDASDLSKGGNRKVMISGKVFLKVVTSIDPAKATAIYVFISMHEVTAYSKDTLPKSRQFEAPDLSSTSFLQMPVTGSSSAISPESPEPRDETVVGSTTSARPGEPSSAAVSASSTLEPVAEPAVAALPASATLELVADPVIASEDQVRQALHVHSLATQKASKLLSTPSLSTDPPQKPTASPTATADVAAKDVTTEELDRDAAFDGNGEVAARISRRVLKRNRSPATAEAAVAAAAASR